MSATTKVYLWEYSDIQDKFYYSAHVDPAVSVCGGVGVRGVGVGRCGRVGVLGCCMSVVCVRLLHPTACE